MKPCHIVTDLGFGDAGKGSIVDALVRSHHANLVIRFNGGPQCAHNVITPDGRHHTFAQWGSGTFIPGTRTYLDKHVLIHPITLLNEGDTLVGNGIPDAFDQLFIHQACPVITPYQQAANQLRELARGNKRHGSCGLGVGETMHDLEDCGIDVLRARDLQNKHVLLRKMRAIREHKIEECRDLITELTNTRAARDPLDMLFSEHLFGMHVVWFLLAGQRVNIIDSDSAKKLILKADGLVCEGAQGVLLDQTYGFFPHVTRSTTTSQWAHDLLGHIGWDEDPMEIGVMRAYQTRHGAGPFVTEDEHLTELLQDTHNRSDNPWQKKFRVGWTDMVALRYAIEANGGVDALAINHLDRPKEAVNYWKYCDSYMFPNDPTPHRKLPVDPEPTLEKQAELTDRIMSAKPVCSIMLTETEHHMFTPRFSDYVSQELEVPVLIRGHGPSYPQKSWLKT